MFLPVGMRMLIVIGGGGMACCLSVVLKISV